MLPKRARPYSWDGPASMREAPTALGLEVGERAALEEDWEAEEGLDFRAERRVRLVSEEERSAPLRSDQAGAGAGHAGRDGDAGHRGGRTRRGRRGGVDDWEPQLPLRARLLRAVSVPQFAAAAVFIVAIAIALGMVWAQPHAPELAPLGGGEASAGAPERGAEAGTATGKAGAGASQAAGKGTDAAPAVFVHVVGAVHRPGVVELPASSRVRDAVAQAGGATDAAMLAGVNLARVVVDGEQIVVPDAAAIAASGAVGGGGTPGATPVGDGPAADGGPVNLNTADQSQLETLPRVGPALAQRILEWRGTNGRFESVDQLLEVPGIGEKTLEGFRDLVAVP